MDKLTPTQRQAFDQARQVISKSRAETICRLKNSENGGCLTVQTRPDIPDVTDEENQAIRSLWSTLDGSTCWMTAVYLLRNN